MAQLTLPSLICSQGEEGLLTNALACLHEDRLTAPNGCPWAAWFVSQHILRIYSTAQPGFYGRSLGHGLVQVSLNHGLSAWQIASIIVHEANHEHRRKQGFDTNSPAEEKMCLREQAYFLERNSRNSVWVLERIAEVDRLGLAVLR